MPTNNSCDYTSPIAVGSGGTGASTLTSNGVLLGNATSAVTATAAGTSGQILVGNTSNAPGWVTPTTGTGLTSTFNATTHSYGLTIPAVVSSGGTGKTSQTAYSLVAGGTSTTGAFQAVGPNASTHAILVSAGSSALPAFTTTGAPYVTSISFDAGTTTLSTYATGTFTPAISIGGATTGITYTTQTGTYWKIGKVCYLSLTILLSSKGALTGGVVITALPFTTASPSCFFSIIGSNLTYSGIPYGYTNNADTTMPIYIMSTGASSVALSNTGLANTTQIQCSGFYFTSS
jgi:hypothetical protein